MNKTEEFDKLVTCMSKCEKCKYLKSQKGKDYSLINIFKDEKFCRNIPSIWTDWYNRLNANIMIIGQDWGPYSDMKKINEEYIKDNTLENWKNIIETEKSSTKKMLTKYVIESSNGKIKNLDNLYITNVIMCARQGENYRGDNINLKVSTDNCKDYLKEQINIVKPKVILSLGFYPLYALSEIYNFQIGNTLTDTIKSQSIIKRDHILIIPLYHPVAQIKKEMQLLQYNKIWNYI